MESLAGVLDALMMRAPHTDPRSAQDAREEGPFKDIDLVEDLFAALLRAVPDRAGDLKRDVLVQLSAERDVYELRASADGQERFPRVEHGLEKTDFEPRAPVRGNRHARARKGLLIIKPRMDVVAAAEHETVKLSGQVVNGRFDPENGDRDPSRFQDRFAVVLVEDIQVP